jgi:hypothetical protein
MIEDAMIISMPRHNLANLGPIEETNMRETLEARIQRLEDIHELQEVMGPVRVPAYGQHA